LNKNQGMHADPKWETKKENRKGELWGTNASRTQKKRAFKKKKTKTKNGVKREKLVLT